MIRFAAEGLPIVVVNDEIRAPGIAVVTANIRHGATMAVEHLLQRGRQRIAMLVDRRTRHFRRPSRRERGYRDVLDAAACRPILGS